MKASKRTKQFLWIAWLLLFPFLTWILYFYGKPTLTSYDSSIIGFFLLMAIVASLPIIVNETPILFVHGISLAVFLLYGLFVEMMLMQLAIVVLLTKVRLRKSEFFRIPLNSLMFLFVSVVSGLIYYLLGGTHEPVNFTSTKVIIPVIGYEVMKMASNQLILTFAWKYIYGKRRSLFGKDSVWEISSTFLVVFPVGLVLYILYTDLGAISLLYVGIPFVSLALILKLYYATEKVNDYLQKASEIGHQLAERLNVNEVLDLFIEKLSSVLPVDYAYILNVVDHQEELHLLRHAENGDEKTVNIRPLKKSEGIGGFVWKTKKAVLFHSKKEWKDISNGYLPSAVESVLCVPVLRNKQLVGVIVLAANQKRAYEKYQLMVVDILGSYLAVSIENAKYYEETKMRNERCALTQLYNYQYFENLLEKEFRKLTSGESLDYLSLILLDLDHFKVINDTYGHQSGNEILCELAERLKVVVGKKGTIARFGGEEFVILLPNVSRSTCHSIAELIRKTIANTPFTLNNSFHANKQNKKVTVTASIGVATAPDEANDPGTLIRNADRAMYTGAKQAGRNKVAAYVK